MFRLAITGGMGAGKSTVRELLQQLGAHGIDADELSRQVVEPGTAGLAMVVAAFGPSVLDEKGRLRRRALSRLVFGDPAQRARLERILHPLIRAEEDRLIAALAARESRGVVAVEVPLLAETGAAERYDAILLVEAPLSLRRERLAAGGRFSPAEVEKRIRVQAGEEERRAVADFVVANDGPPASLKEKVDRVWRELRSRSAI